MNFDPIINILVQFFNYTWWFLLFLILWPLFKNTWRFWREETYIHSNEMKLIHLELKMPREITKNPQAMEQVLNGIHQLRNAPGNLEEWWVDGEVTKWFVFEMVSFGGEVHFYVHGYHKQRHLIEASFYAFYSDLELVEVEDYMSRLPISVREMHAQGYDLWGSEMIYTRQEKGDKFASAYPIKTYKDFESPDEEKQYDPISQFVEILGKVKPEEIVGVQILIAPAEDGWSNRYHELVAKLRATEKESVRAGRGSLFGQMTFPGGPMPAAVQKEEKPQPIKFMMRTPGETDTLKAVEENLSKPAFETLIRFMYLSPEPMFYDSFPRRGLKGAFNQYSAYDLNAFTMNNDISTRVKIWDKPYIFPNKRVEYRKARLLYNYRHRLMPPENWVGKLLTSYFYNWNFGTKLMHMTTQCVATIFHPPTAAVLIAPHIQRVESRRVGPPAGLAIFGGETDIEKFQE
ncbi:MAG: hypothetical protein V1489_01395 [Candidatus Liptonbacteria bacterium]